MMIDYDDDDVDVVVDDDDVNDAGTRQGGCFAANAVLWKFQCSALSSPLESATRL